MIAVDSFRAPYSESEGWGTEIASPVAANYCGRFWFYSQWKCCRVCVSLIGVTFGTAARESAKYERPPMGDTISFCAARSMLLALKPSLIAVVGKERNSRFFQLGKWLAMCGKPQMIQSLIRRWVLIKPSIFKPSLVNISTNFKDLINPVQRPFKITPVDRWVDFSSVASLARSSIWGFSCGCMLPTIPSEKHVRRLLIFPRTVYQDCGFQSRSQHCSRQFL